MKTPEYIDAARRDFGSRVRRIRMEQGLSQYTFARMIGMDRSYLIDVEKGRRNVTLDTIARVASGLDVPISQLFDGVDIEYQGR